MTSKNKKDGRLGAYIEWIRKFRQGFPAVLHPPPPPKNDQIAILARELSDLAKAIRQREEETRRLFEIVEDVENNLFLTDVLDHIYNGFKGLLPYERIGCALISDDELYATSVWAHSELGPVKVPTGFTQPLENSSLQPLVNPYTPRIINDLEAYLKDHPESHSTRLIVDEGGRSNLTCPLIARGKRLGFIFFTSAHKNAYEATHQDIFGRLAGQIAAVIDRSNAYQKLFEENRSLSERRQSLEKEVETDPLTSLVNRKGIDHHLLRLTSACDHGFAAIMADIDHFKSVNDRFGHAAGDEVLKEFSRRLKMGVRSRDIVGRFGGEEFLILLEDTDGATMRTIAERLRRLIEQSPFMFGETPIYITASFGAVYFSPGSLPVRTPNDVVIAADELLYRAKRQGRNRVATSGE